MYVPVFGMNFFTVSNYSPSVLECIVYFMDNSGIHLFVDGGEHVTAGDLFEMVMEEMNYPSDCRDVFSLWLVSDLLGK